jgi:hypothetical protein
MADPRDYRTRKEYRWAKKLESKEHARQTAPWRYPGALVGVVIGFATHSFLIGLITLVVACAVFAAILARARP